MNDHKICVEHAAGIEKCAHSCVTRIVTKLLYAYARVLYFKEITRLWFAS